MISNDNLVEILYDQFPGLKEIVEKGGDADDYIKYYKRAPANKQTVAGFNNYNNIINKVKTKGLNSVIYNDYVTGVTKSYIWEEGRHRESISTPVIIVTTTYCTFAVTSDGKIMKYWG